MSLNSVTLSPSGTPIPLSEELNINRDVHVEYVLVDAISKPSKKFEGRGKVVLTDLRLILLADNPTADFSSLSLPHTAIHPRTHDTPRLKLFVQRETIVLKIKHSSGADLGDGAQLELRSVKGELEPFRSFVGAFDKTHERSVAMSRAKPEDGQDLPAYAGESSSTTYVPDDAPPDYDD